MVRNVASASKPDSLSSIPETYMVEGGSNLCKSSSDLHVLAMACLHTHTHHIKCFCSLY